MYIIKKERVIDMKKDSQKWLDYLRSESKKDDIAIIIIIAMFIILGFIVF